MPSYAITGSNRGLGLEFVRQLSADSSNTVVAAVRSLSGELDDLNALIRDAKAKVHVLECDTSDVASVKAFGDAVAKALGHGVKLDYLLNNAGINATPDESALTMTPDSLSKHIAINVVGPAETLKAVLPLLRDGSVVLNVTSGLGSCGLKLAKCTTYSVSKAALNMLTVHQSEELKGRGVRVLCVDPGWVKTRMGGVGAVLEPEESIAGMLKVLREGESGSFYRYDGSVVAW